MLIKKPDSIPPSEITPPEVYWQRRRFLQATLAGAASLSLPALSQAIPKRRQVLKDVVPGPFSIDESPTDYDDVTSYNNFIELGSGKRTPARRAQFLRTEPWSLTIAGECEKPGTYALEDFIKPHTLEERTYALRCVETWSMVIPWVGFPLADVLKRFQPTSKAKFVKFSSIYDPRRLPGQRISVFNWPYVEALRIDEAMHPLTLLAVGLYGEVLPNQNGAPIRLVIPWKYGFKSSKSIVKIEFVEPRPETTWNALQPDEYGFYANVNPQVEHPRWSQRRERRIGDWFKRKTLMFNGYEEQVASLYSGMNL